jgi:hypothetical protein
MPSVEIALYLVMTGLLVFAVSLVIELIYFSLPAIVQVRRRLMSSEVAVQRTAFIKLGLPSDANFIKETSERRFWTLCDAISKNQPVHFLAEDKALYRQIRLTIHLLFIVRVISFVFAGSGILVCIFKLVN